MKRTTINTGKTLLYSAALFLCLSCASTRNIEIQGKENYNVLTNEVKFNKKFLKIIGDAKASFKQKYKADSKL